ncbi:hypothetical protein DQ04_01141140 [Trypanosoma grayi]|uniref:hypothetical protein n=1 Tax=Trypanosoma grayi TaxID=71804 RepID=UPI0004F4BC69|nr:hypothetical protein DQ04_01141140 [Trypanosoma grayi]KEG13228.1 hypothetical protein DQ04_01141140 [Trypanosoma grayi]
MRGWRSVEVAVPASLWCCTALPDSPVALSLSLSLSLVPVLFAALMVGRLRGGRRCHPSLPRDRCDANGQRKHRRCAYRSHRACTCAVQDAAPCRSSGFLLLLLLLLLRA